MEFVTKSLPAEKELLIADGGSTDRTLDIINSYAALHPEVIPVSNPKRFVPFALNECIRRARGEYIIRLDAHSEYASDYFLKVIGAFEKTGAEIVGGPMRAKGNTSFQRAVAVCTSTAFGVGDSKFHDETAEGYTDSVYLGAWRKNIFDRTGMFDEEMFRNQDDEFHYRARSRGMKIYLDPAIKSWYYPRGTFRLLMKQYFQYGLFKPLVLKKVKSGMRLRHLIPGCFVLYLISLILFLPVLGWFSLIPLFLYLLIDLFFSFGKQNTASEKIISLAVYPALHISYGAGFLLGTGEKFRKYFFKG